VNIRDAQDEDAERICELYNALIDTTTVAWTEDHEPVEARREWLKAQRHRGNPVLVAEVDGRVIGFTSYGDFRDSTKWRGYRFTVELTIHVDGAHHRSGVGRALLQELMARAASAGKHAMIGAIDSANEGSVRFHERLGFTEVARIPEIGHKFDHWLTLVLMHRIIGAD
jgi:L-amino acid N-acyltransferase